MTTNAVAGRASVFSVEGANLGAARQYTLTMNQATIDTTSDDTSRHETAVVGLRSWTIDIDCLYIYTDAAQKYLEEHLTAANPASLTVILTMPDGRTYSGTALLTSLTITSPHEDVITASISLKGTGALTTSTS